MGQASVEGAYHSEISGFVQFCFRVPGACGRRPRASTHGVDLLMDLEEQAPLLRGCPDRSGERPARGGARTLRSNVWGEARAAHFAFPASGFCEVQPIRYPRVAETH